MSNNNHIPFFLVDAFTVKTSFTGNPAAVCVLPSQTVANSKAFQQTKMTLPIHLLPKNAGEDKTYENNVRQVLQKIANEMQQSETVFVQRLLSFDEEKNENNNKNPSATFLIRWFSPETEVMLCGHATLAASHCLFSAGFVDPSKIQLIHYISPSYNKNYSVICNQNNNGSSTCSSSSSSSYTLKFPNNKPHQVDFYDPKDYAFTVAEAIKQSLSKNNNKSNNIITFKSMWYHANSRKYIVELSSPQEIESGLNNLDITKLHSLLTKDRVFSVTFTARINNNNSNNNNNQNVKHSEPFDQTRFVATSRHFAPWVGIPEDPVTGAAHVVLGPMWVERIEKEGKQDCDDNNEGNKMKTKEYDFYQAFPGRGGIVKLRVESDSIVALTGTARTVVSGNLILTSQDVIGVIKRSKM